MGEPRAKLIADILEEHLEELSFLWAQRQDALRSPDYSARELADMESRIEAHVGGLLVGRETIVPLVDESLGDPDSAVVFAAAYVLLRLGSETALEKVSTAFGAAQGEPLEGIKQALCYARIDDLADEMRSQLANSAPPIAVAAAEVLAFHRLLEPEDSRLGKLLADEDPQVRAAAWRAVALLDSQGEPSPNAPQHEAN